MCVSLMPDMKPSVNVSIVIIFQYFYINGIFHLPIFK